MRGRYFVRSLSADFTVQRALVANKPGGIVSKSYILYILFTVVMSIMSVFLKNIVCKVNIKITGLLIKSIVLNVVECL